MTETWLLADVGASNTRLGLATDGRFGPDTARSLRNADHADFESLLRSYLAKTGAAPLTAICAGVAGPLAAEAAQLTNHDWRIDARALAALPGAPQVRLINDLQAQAYALGDLPDGASACLVPGRYAPAGATRAVLGLGTGCNSAVAYSTAQGLFVPPSETGHTRLPLLPHLPDRLVRALGWHGAHLPVEAALCGRGLMRIAAACGSDAGSPADVIARAQGEPEAVALRHYLRLLGTVAGDIVLTHLPMGGLYLIGGLARAIAPLLTGPVFTGAFHDKGPYRHITEAVPVHVITDDNAALRGCAHVLRAC